MNRKQYENINLTCVLQQAEELSSESCPTGVMSINAKDGSFRFEEAVRKGRAPRNPKLFDGKYCSLVHMQNGRYQVHMKTITASGTLDRNALAFAVYSELLTALNIID